jgi:hypothetical protein
MILTDDNGVPILRPTIAEYGTDYVAFVRAMHAYNTRVSQVANDGFNVAWRAKKLR